MIVSHEHQLIFLKTHKTGYRKERLEFSPWGRDEVRRLFAHEIGHFGYPDSPPPPQGQGRGRDSETAFSYMILSTAD